MMTREMLIAALEALGQDVTFDCTDEEITVTIQDFGGFDRHWCEIERELDDEDAVDAFLEMLEEKSLSWIGDFYKYYTFEGFSVCVGYASFDI